MSSTDNNETKPLANYVLLGNSGLRVSPVCLGTMSFGDKWGIGASAEESEKVLDRYVELGGNFIDTANKYHEGETEEIVGNWMEKRGNRDDLVIATKYSLNMKQGNVNYGGNQRKNMFKAVEDSLKRLKTDYIDVYYVHFWDYTTPVKEVMRGLNDLVSMGKIHYVAFSDVPAWVVSQAQTVSSYEGWAPIIAYQGQYNWLQRTMENDVIPCSIDQGLGVVPWAVLGGGKLTGKYRKGKEPEGSRKGWNTVSDADYDHIEKYLELVDKLDGDHKPAAVAVAWCLKQKGITSILLGARNVDQLDSALKGLEIEFTDEQLKELTDAAPLELTFPHSFLGENGVQHDPSKHSFLKQGGKIQKRPQY